MTEWSRIVLVKCSVLLVAPLLLAGCAALGGGGLPNERDVRNSMMAEERQSEAYGYGVAESMREARDLALADIAEQISVVVQSASTQTFERSEQASGTTASSELSSTVGSLANVHLEDASMSQPVETSQGWMVQASISRDRLDELRNQARRQAPVLARFEVLSALPQDAVMERVELAQEGLSAARDQRVENDRLFTDAMGETTFGVYFERERESALRRVLVLPIFENGISELDADTLLHIQAIDRETHAAQPGVLLSVNGTQLSTGSEGRTRSVLLGELVSDGFEQGDLDIRLVPGDQQTDAIELQRFQLGEMHSRTTEVYVYTAPSGAVFSIDGVDSVAPTTVDLVSDTHSIEVLGTDDYAGTTQLLDIQDGTPFAFVAFDLDERRYGHIDVSVQGDAEINLERRIDPGFRRTGSEIQERVEAGVYDLSITLDDDHQEVVEDITLNEGDEFGRNYLALHDRGERITGLRYFLEFRAAGRMGDEYKLPGFDGSMTSVEGLADSDDAQDAGITGVDDYSIRGFGVGAQFYSRPMGMPITTLLRANMHSGEVTFERDSHPSTAVAEFTTLGGELGLGLWHPVRLDSLSNIGTVWAVSGFTSEVVSWNAEDTHSSIRDDLPSNGGVHTHPFVEIGGQYELYGINFRAPLNDEGIMMISISIGGQDIETRYDHPAVETARPGKHY